MGYSKIIERAQKTIGDISTTPVFGDILAPELSQLSAGVNIVAPLLSGDVTETLTGLSAALNELNIDNILEISSALGIANMPDIIAEYGIENLENVLTSLGVASTFEKFTRDNLLELLGVDSFQWVVDKIPDVAGVFSFISASDIVSILGDGSLPALPNVSGLLDGIENLSNSDISNMAANAGSLLSSIATSGFFPATILENISDVLNVVDNIDRVSNIIGVTTNIVDYANSVGNITSSISNIRNVALSGDLSSIISSIDGVVGTLPTAFSQITNFVPNVDSIVGAFDISSAMENVKLFSGSFNFPVTGGDLLDSFGPKFNPFTGDMDLFNKGLDIAAKYGESVKNVSDGIVTYVGDMGCYGNTVIIKHADNMFSKFSLLGEISVSIGDTVGASASIGTVGSVDTPHIRYELRTSDIPDDSIPAIDPAALFGGVEMNFLSGVKDMADEITGLTSIANVAGLVGGLADAKQAVANIIENPLGIIPSSKEIIVWNTGG